MDFKRQSFSGTGVSPVRIETHGRDARATSVVFKPSPIHGIGGFARNDFSGGKRIIEYLGEKITKQQSLARCEQSNEYISRSMTHMIWTATSIGIRRDF